MTVRLGFEATAARLDFFPRLLESAPARNAKQIRPSRTLESAR